MDTPISWRFDTIHRARAILKCSGQNKNRCHHRQFLKGIDE